MLQVVSFNQSDYSRVFVENSRNVMYRIVWNNSKISRIERNLPTYHQSHLRLNHNIVPGSIPIRPRLSIPRNRSINQLRINPRQRLIIHGVFLQRPREIILDENIRFLRKLMENLLPRSMLEGESKGLFISVDAEEICAFTLSLFSRAGNIGRVGRTPVSSIVAFYGMLDFYDFCSWGCELMFERQGLGGGGGELTPGRRGSECSRAIHGCQNFIADTL